MKLESLYANRKRLSIDSTDDAKIIDIIAKNRYSLQNVMGCHIVGVHAERLGELLLDQETLGLITAIRSNTDIRLPANASPYTELPLTLKTGAVTVESLNQATGGLAKIVQRDEIELNYTISKDVTLTLLLYNFVNDNGVVTTCDPVPAKVVLDETESEYIVTKMSNKQVGKFIPFKSNASILDLRVTPTLVDVRQSSNYTFKEILQRARAVYNYDMDVIESIASV